jgi:hypothetical protein
MHSDASRHSYHDRTPVITSFPLVKSSAVHLGLLMRMVMAANLVGTSVT